MIEKSIEVREENYGGTIALFWTLKSPTDLNWSCKITFENGIEQTIKWVSDNWDKITKMELDYVHHLKSLMKKLPKLLTRSI